MSLFEKIVEKIKNYIGLTPYEAPKEEEKSLAKKALDFFNSLWKAGLAALFIISFLFQNTRIPTGSMESTILVGDFVIVNKYIYGPTSPKYIPFTQIQIPNFSLPAFKEPEKGEIVVFEFPGYRDELIASELNVNYVKRCVGAPGDTIEVRDKVLFVNGKEYWLPPHIQYLSPIPTPKGVQNPRVFPVGKDWNEDNYGPLVVPKKGMQIKMTPESAMAWKTTIDREFGRAVVTVRNGLVYIDNQVVDSYTFKKDYFFMMGDNRDDSLDSRFWGCVPRDLVVGRASIVLFSWDREIPFSQPFKLLKSVRPERILKLLN